MQAPLVALLVALLSDLLASAQLYRQPMAWPVHRRSAPFSPAAYSRASPYFRRRKPGRMQHVWPQSVGRWPTMMGRMPAYVRPYRGARGPMAAFPFANAPIGQRRQHSFVPPTASPFLSTPPPPSSLFIPQPPDHDATLDTYQEAHHHSTFQAGAPARKAAPQQPAISKLLAPYVIFEKYSDKNNHHSPLLSTSHNSAPLPPRRRCRPANTAVEWGECVTSALLLETPLCLDGAIAPSNDCAPAMQQRSGRRIVSQADVTWCCYQPVGAKVARLTKKSLLPGNYQEGIDLAVKEAAANRLKGSPVKVSTSTTSSANELAPTPTLKAQGPTKLATVVVTKATTLTTTLTQTMRLTSTETLVVTAPGERTSVTVTELASSITSDPTTITSTVYRPLTVTATQCTATVGRRRAGVGLYSAKVQKEKTTATGTGGNLLFPRTQVPWRGASSGSQSENGILKLRHISPDQRRSDRQLDVFFDDDTTSTAADALARMFLPRRRSYRIKMA